MVNQNDEPRGDDEDTDTTEFGMKIRRQRKAVIIEIFNGESKIEFSDARAYDLMKLLKAYFNG